MYCYTMYLYIFSGETSYNKEGIIQGKHLQYKYLQYM